MIRNRENSLFFIFFLGISVIAAIIGFKIGAAAGTLVITTVIMLGTEFYVFTSLRYRKIAQLSEQIDMALHNTEHILISEANEGELSVLQSEIVKMTVRIREQNAALRKEKTYLAESLADISHQLRTPLTSVNIILSLLNKETDRNKQRDLLREAEGLFEQMDFLLTALLKLSRLDADIVVFNKEQIDVESLILFSLRSLIIPMELHNIQVQTDISEKIYINGDFKWLSEALQNVIKNCMESVSDGGKIRITCEDNPLFTELNIYDDGPGFKQEDLPHLFERFYRSKDSGATGYGIGLALCRTIIMRHGGVVTAKNYPQGGAQFSIRFSK